MAATERDGYLCLAKTPALELASIEHEVEFKKPPHAKEKNGMHRRNPTLMACSLAAAVILALVHHFFYRYWNGKKVLDGTQQQWIIRGGTFFAFAFKVCLALGGGIAYVQFLWQSLRMRSFRVREIDSMFGALSNPLAFRFLKLWSGVPLLTAIAILVWLMPLAAIITPGSLTVVLTSEVSSGASPVPGLDFQYHAASYGTAPFLDAFASASDDLIRLAFASATLGSILSMAAPQPNSSYTTTFDGPTLQCFQGKTNDLIAMNKAASDYINNSGGIGVDYLAWVPQSRANYSYEPLRAPLFQETDFSSPVQDDPSIPGMNIFIFRPNENVYDSTGYLIQCGLYNVSYTTEFTFESGLQHLQIEPAEKSEQIIHSAQYYSFYGNQNITNSVMFNRSISYESLMYAFGVILTGSVSISNQVGSLIVHSTLLQQTLIASRLSAALLDPTPTNATIRSAFEELFQNITFSMFSSNKYLLDPSNATQALLMSTPNVTVTQFVNEYTYKVFDLWLAYGLALVGEVVCLAIGFYALYNNGVAYTNDFSSILRSTRNQELDSLLGLGEFDGADPAPEHLLDSSVTYRLGTDRAAGFRLGKGKG